jgi:hypothetical protein
MGRGEGEGGEDIPAAIARRIVAAERWNNIFVKVERAKVEVESKGQGSRDCVHDPSVFGL